MTPPSAAAKRGSRGDLSLVSPISASKYSSMPTLSAMYLSLLLLLLLLLVVVVLLFL
jgi:hypothetical protein